MEFNDHVAQGELYKPWTKYMHPLYGEIEIGGWTKMSSRLPHPFMLQDLVHRNASAVIFSAGQTPEIKLELKMRKGVKKNKLELKGELQYQPCNDQTCLFPVSKKFTIIISLKKKK